MTTPHPPAHKRFKFSQNTVLVWLALLVGVLGGLGNIVFRFAVDWVHFLIAEVGGGYLDVGPSDAGHLLLPLLPMAGALLLIPLALLFPGQIYGYRFPGFLERVNVRGGLLKKRLILPRLLAAALTLGSGGSAGVEGPIAQLGGGLAFFTGQFLQASAVRMRMLIASGAAAGIAATFDAPITGVMFAVEIVLQGDFQIQSFIILVIAAGVATVISRAAFGMNPAFIVPEYNLLNPAELLSYVVLGICCGLAAIAFIKVFYWTRDFFDRSHLPIHLRPVIGAFLVGVCALALPRVMGNGYEFIQEALDGKLAWSLMFCLVAGKIVATSLTIGSGGVGGTFAPALYIGTMLGGGIGVLTHQLLPTEMAAPGAYAMVGMAGFLAAVTQAPLTAAFLLFELTGSYMVVLPILFCISSALLVVWQAGMSSIDEVELERRGINLRAGKEATILQEVRVAEVMSRDFQVIPERMPLPAILTLIAESRHEYFPVIADDGSMHGAITFRHLRELLLTEGLNELVVAQDIATDTGVSLTRNDTLGTAMDLLGRNDTPALPVVAEPGSRRVIGIVNQGNLIAAYNAQLLLRYSKKNRE